MAPRTMNIPAGARQSANVIDMRDPNWLDTLMFEASRRGTNIQNNVHDILSGLGLIDPYAGDAQELGVGLFPGAFQYSDQFPAGFEQGIREDYAINTMPPNLKAEALLDQQTAFINDVMSRAPTTKSPFVDPAYLDVQDMMAIPSFNFIDPATSFRNFQDFEPVTGVGLGMDEYMDFGPQPGDFDPLDTMGWGNYLNELDAASQNFYNPNSRQVTAGPTRQAAAALPNAVPNAPMPGAGRALGQMTPEQRQVVRDVIAGEAVAGDLDDMTAIASVIENRAAQMGVRPDQVVSVPSEFNAYGKPMPEGNDSEKNLAMVDMAIGYVETYGPTHKATFYATPAKVSGLPAAVREQNLLSAQTSGHKFFEDAKNLGIYYNNNGKFVTARPNPARQEMSVLVAENRVPTPELGMPPATLTASDPRESIGYGLTQPASETSSTDFGGSFTTSAPKFSTSVPPSATGTSVMDTAKDAILNGMAEMAAGRIDQMGVPGAIPSTPGEYGRVGTRDLGFVDKYAAPFPSSVKQGLQYDISKDEGFDVPSAVPSAPAPAPAPAPSGGTLATMENARQAVNTGVPADLGYTLGSLTTQPTAGPLANPTPNITAPASLDRVMEGFAAGRSATPADTTPRSVKSVSLPPANIPGMPMPTVAPTTSPTFSNPEEEQAIYDATGVAINPGTFGDIPGVGIPTVNAPSKSLAGPVRTTTYPDLPTIPSATPAPATTAPQPEEQSTAKPGTPQLTQEEADKLSQEAIEAQGKKSGFFEALVGAIIGGLTGGVPGAVIGGLAPTAKDALGNLFSGGGMGGMFSRENASPSNAMGMGVEGFQSVPTPSSGGSRSVNPQTGQSAYTNQYGVTTMFNSAGDPVGSSGGASGKGG
jgi:hypothetical protein